MWRKEGRGGEKKGGEEGEGEGEGEVKKEKEKEKERTERSKGLRA
jgi:hypothetical protein